MPCCPAPSSPYAHPLGPEGWEEGRKGTRGTVLAQHTGPVAPLSLRRALGLCR